MLQQRYLYCEADDPCSDEGVCSRLAGHDGDHYDAVTERRWHNTGQAYGPGDESCRASR